MNRTLYPSTLTDKDTKNGVHREHKRKSSYYLTKQPEANCLWRDNATEDDHE